MSNSSAESPVDTKNPKVPAHSESDDADRKDVESLLQEIEILKVNNENMRAKLLEASMLANSYLEESGKLKKQIEQLTRPPLFIASVMEVEKDMALIRQHGNNQEVVTKIPPHFQGEIQAGMRVCVNAAFSIVSIISRAADVRAQVMELINSPGIDYDMIGGLDEGHLSVLLAPGIVFFALKACVRHRLGVAKGTELFHYGDEGTCIAALLRGHYSYDVFGVNRQGGIVGRFQLAIFHVIFFHPHEGGVPVCLGKAVPVAKAVVVVIIFLLTGKISLYGFNCFLPRRFSFTFPLDEFLIPLERIQTFPQFFQVFGPDLFSPIKPQTKLGG